ncbi:ribosomal protein S6 kinase-like 1 isoform X2 [Lepisosteus oculatus]|uniref:ribosomal protein S6 kinase-like 1 isoform X2 n=1 Tax=Lepisosteus oculatus TaxID=7918 RepID=UPI00371FF35D
MQTGLGETQHTDPRALVFLQARVCLEHIRSQTKPTMAKRDYLVDAAKQIRLALDREVSEDYEAAFNYYKNGVDLLLKGVQVDPNKERREAVKRKTTQYLKRAEEIFISHLQGSLGSVSSKSEGYSSLRFRPVRVLSSPVEDLKMCKVIGVIDKVLTVQNSITKETFVVKSLPKSSWDGHEQQTIIPQGVPFMVQLLRYYVSEDAVFLHLEHVQGGRLFSKLHKRRKDSVKEHPECCSPTHRKIKLKNSYTSPTLSLDYDERSRCTTKTAFFTEDSSHPDSSDTESPASWAEARHHLETFNTHSYSEDTGCLLTFRKDQVCRCADPQRSDSWGCSGCNSGEMLSASSGDFPQEPQSPCPPHCESQETSALLPDCPCQYTRESPNSASDVSPKTMINADSAAEASVTWCAAAARSKDCKKSAPCFAPSIVPGGKGDTGVPQANEYSVEGSDCKTESRVKETVSQGISLQSKDIEAVPTNLQFTSYDQSQDDGTRKECCCAPATGGACKQCGRKKSDGIPSLELFPVQSRGVMQPGLQTGGSSEVSKGMEVSQSFRSACSSACPLKVVAGLTSGNAHKRMTGLAQSPNAADQCDLLTALKPESCGENDPTLMSSRNMGQGEEDEGWELLNTVTGDLPQNEEAGLSNSGDSKAVSQCFSSRKDCQGLVPSSDVHIEVDGWCLLPKVPSRQATNKPRQACWGLPEDKVRLWVAQIVLAVESLHQQGILCRDLNPRNILLDSTGKVRLTYFGQWSEVQPQMSTKAVEYMYCAPEVGGVSEVTEACDWWSLGALLYELLTGMPLRQFHPSGVLPHTQLIIPDHISMAAASLLTEVRPLRLSSSVA